MMDFGSSRKAQSVVASLLAIAFLASCSSSEKRAEKDELAAAVGESDSKSIEQNKKADNWDSAGLEDSPREAFDAVKATEKKSVSSEDLKRLSKARASRSETEIVQAASVLLSKDPNHLEALNTMGIFYYETKKLGMAKILFKRALKSHPNSPTLYNNLGVVYLAENDLPLAIESFKKSISLKSGYRTGETNLSSIYLEYLDYNRSLAPLESAYRASRSDIRRGSASSVEIANNYGVALMGLGQNDKASKVFEEIDSAGVRNPVPYLNYAILLGDVLKKKTDAIRIISKLKFMTEDREILRRVQELEKKIGAT